MSENGCSIPKRKILLERGSVSMISKLTKDKRLTKKSQAFGGMRTLIISKCEIICSLFIAPNSVFSDCEISSFKKKFNMMINLEAYFIVFVKNSIFLAASGDICGTIDLVAIELLDAMIYPSSDLKYWLPKTFSFTKSLSAFKETISLLLKFSYMSM